MVRALLAGTKTQTRRALKPQPREHHWFGLPGYEHRLFPSATGDGFAARSVHSHQIPGNERAVDLGEWISCPYGAPGDRLWVRETWARAGEVCDVVEYRADNCDPTGGKWRPSIYMPRWASRITLEVTDVRVERVGDISEEDSIAEGVSRGLGGNWVDYQSKQHPNGDYTGCVYSARGSFQTLWAAINGVESMRASPWVWCVEFKQVNRS
jgi:hypothetical protein